MIISKNKYELELFNKFPTGNKTFILLECFYDKENKKQSDCGCGDPENCCTPHPYFSFNLILFNLNVVGFNVYSKLALKG